MSGINKHSLPGWILGMALGVAFSGVVYAGTVTNPDFASGNTLNAAHMNNIKSAVNDNDTRINNLQTSSGACTKNAGDDTGGMVRVGPICVDKFLARATIGTCTGDGTTNCASVIALSTATGSAAADFSWAQAVRACANAGKRLLTPGEYMAAFISGSLSETVTDTLEFVDAMLTLSSTITANDPSSPGTASPAQGGYMGPRTAASGKVQMVTNVDYDLVNPDGGSNFLFFRCAR